MSHAEVVRLVTRCTQDRAFLAKVREGREQVVRQEGFELTEEEWQEFHSIDWSQSDEQILQKYSGESGPS